MHKHLTTPWEAKGDAVFAGKDCIALCDTDNATPEVYEAKARLMASAPDLLAALQGMQMEWDRLTQYGSPMANAANPRVAAMKAAIARALPEEK